mmetsp:Transcript_44794/g.130457  ORF Transcript_44794/g.130457 Transcript_44794/m.130457 type:complete len:398 (+) Transcript_44794:649-1842(+)
MLFRLRQKAQPNHPWQHHEQLDVDILAHARKRRRDALCAADFGDEVAQGVEQLLVLHVAGAQLPALLPISEARDEAGVVAQMGVHSLEAVGDFTEVLAHGLVRLDDVVRQDPRGDEPLRHLAALLRAVAAAERVHRVEEDVHDEVVAALAADVGHGIQVPNASNQALLRLDVPGHILPRALRVLLFETGHGPLVLDGADDEAAGLLLDLDEFGDVLVLEACPCEVQRHEGRAELRARRALRPLRLARGLAPTLQHRAEVPPSPLEGLGAPHGLGAELEFVPVDPNRGVLLEASLQHIDAVVPGLVGEERTVVDREVLPVRPWGLVQAESCGCDVHGLQVRRAGVRAVFALGVDTVAIHQKAPARSDEPLNRHLLRRAQVLRVLAQAHTEHGCTVRRW